MISNVAQHKSKNGVLAPYWDSALIEKTASGSVASFSDGADGMPMVSVLASIEPKQSGSGDPSPDNVRPISGWDSVNVTRSGKNLLPYGAGRTSAGITYTLNSDGTISASGTSTGTSFCNAGGFTLPSGSYILNGCPTNSNSITMDIRNATGGSGIVSGADSGNGFSFTLTEETTGVVNIRIPSGVTVNNLLFKPMIRLASETDATYAPYTAQTYPTTLPQTVYGGSLDVVSGVLTIDRALVDLGTLTWAYSDTSGHERFYSQQIPNLKGADSSEVANAICSALKVVSNNNTYAHTYDNSVSLSATRYIYVYASAYTDAATFKTAMSGVQLCYELATPQTIQLTPTEVDSLLADNNVWADSGNISVTYRADSTLAYNQLTNAIVSLGGNI